VRFAQGIVLRDAPGRFPAEQLRTTGMSIPDAAGRIYPLRAGSLFCSIGFRAREYRTRG